MAKIPNDCWPTLRSSLAALPSITVLEMFGFQRGLPRNAYHAHTPIECALTRPEAECLRRSQPLALCRRRIFCQVLSLLLPIKPLLRVCHRVSAPDTRS